MKGYFSFIFYLCRHEKAQKKGAVPLATKEQSFIIYLPTSSRFFTTIFTVPRGFPSQTIYRDGIMILPNGGTAKPTLQRFSLKINNWIETLHHRLKHVQHSYWPPNVYKHQLIWSSTELWTVPKREIPTWGTGKTAVQTHVTIIKWANLTALKSDLHRH